MTTTDQSLRGRTALVTGATSGIGRAAATQLAREGAEVIVHGRDSQRGEEVVAEIVHALGHARFVAADLSDPTEVRRLADEAGDVDVLVNNAGFSWFGPTADLDVATYDALFDSNVRAAYFLVAALAPKMAANGGGSIINIASMVANIGIAGAAAYGARRRRSRP
jgi:short-subunit dehydrogenase